MTLLFTDSSGEALLTGRPSLWEIVRIADVVELERLVKDRSVVSTDNYEDAVRLMAHFKNMGFRVFPANLSVVRSLVRARELKP